MGEGVGVGSDVGKENELETSSKFDLLTAYQSMLAWSSITRPSPYENSSMLSTDVIASR